MTIESESTELQLELPNMSSDFYNELSKNYVYKKNSNIKHIFSSKPCVEEEPSQISFRFKNHFLK